MKKQRKREKEDGGWGLEDNILLPLSDRVFSSLRADKFYKPK